MSRIGQGWENVVLTVKASFERFMSELVLLIGDHGLAKQSRYQNIEVMWAAIGE